MNHLWNCNMEGESLGKYVVDDCETPKVYKAPIFTDEWLSESLMGVTYQDWDYKEQNQGEYHETGR